MTSQSLVEKLAALLASQDVNAYLVGGYLRDRLLSRPNGRDIDIALEADAAPIAEGLAEALGGSLVPLSPERGMFRVVIPDDEAEESHGGAWTVDLTGFSGDLAAELARRDFSVNAMALPLSDWISENWISENGQAAAGSTIDPLGGRQDLAQKCLRALGPGIFEDDAGRLLRSVRLSAQLGFRMDPDTVRLIMKESHRLSGVSPDRVREEFLTILSLDGAKGQLEALDRLGLLFQVVPELEQTKGVDQPRMHYWDVWGHTIHAVEAAELVMKGHQNSPIYSCVPWTPESEAYFAQTVTDGHSRGTVLKLAALFHDIAKPQTKSLEPDGRTRFFGHSEQGAEVAAARLRYLRVSSKGVGMVSKMVEQHLRPTNMKNEGGWPTDRAIHRYFRELGDVAVDTLYLCLADYLAARGPELAHADWLNHARMVAHILHVGTTEPVSPSSPRLITGRELMDRFRLPPGPQIGSLLQEIEESRAAGEIQTQEQALEFAARSLNRQGDS